MTFDGSVPMEALGELFEDGIVVLDSEGQIQWADQVFLDLFGVDSAEGRTLRALLREGSGEVDLGVVGESTPETVSVRPVSGVEATLRIELRAFSEGTYLGRVRQPDQDLQAELEVYRTVLDAVEDAIYMTDANRRFQWINSAMAEMGGYNKEAIVGRHLFEFLYEDQKAAAERRFERLASDEGPDVLTFDMEVPRPDGTQFPAEIRAAALPGDGFAGTVGIVRDVSDRKERERELERKTERLEEFADVVSHDLRSPLTVATLQLELAAQDCDSEHLANVKAALDRMDSLIDDLLTLARQDEDVTDTEPVDVGRVARESWKTVSTQAASLVVEDPPRIECKETRLREALENLFRNAVEHGGDDVTVRVGDLDVEEGFYVADDGPGIPEDEREEAFEAGYTTADNGTGFGLNIVWKIAESHGWNVEIHGSEVGGARFVFLTGS